MRTKITYRRKLNAETCEFEDVKVFLIDKGGKTGWAEVSEEEYLAASPDKIGVPMIGGWTKPVLSESMGVLSSQAQELRDFCDKAGVPTEVLPDGTPVIRSMEHKRAHAKARGFTCRDHYY